MDAVPLPLLVAAFVAVLLFIEAAYILWRENLGAAQRQTNRRLAMIRQGQSRRVALRKLQRQHGPLDAALARSLPHLEKLLVEAGVTQPPSALLAIAGVSAVLLGSLLINLIAVPFAVAAIAGVAFGTGAPLLYLLRRRTQRLETLARQLPQAVDLIVRGLQVGHPIPAAMALVAKQMADPIASEFGIIVDEIAYGRSLADALGDMSVRSPQPDLRYLVAVIEIQNQSGGNLAEVLRNLSGVMRARFHMFGKIKAASAEGRMSAVAISSLPVFVAIVISVLKPDYFSAVSDHPAFWPIMSLTPILLISGWITIWRLVNFKV